MISAPISKQSNSDEQISRLVEDNIKLVYWFTNKYGTLKGMTREEYESEMMISLWKSARTFDSSMTRFSTYAAGGMYLHRKQLKHYIKRKGKHGTLTIIEKVHGNIPEDATSCFDLRDKRSVIARLMQPLTQYQRTVVGFMCDGMSRREISKLMGKPIGTTSECYRSAIRRMRKYAEERGMECPL